jgi:hypothetical protein
VLVVEIYPLLNVWIDLNCGIEQWDYDTDFRMERMENSIHELIAALNPSAPPAQSQDPRSSSPLRHPPVAAPINNEEGDTDEDDDSNTRPTAGGTDESEERQCIVELADNRFSGSCRNYPRAGV